MSFLFAVIFTCLAHSSADYRLKARQFIESYVHGRSGLDMRELDGHWIVKWRLRPGKAQILYSHRLSLKLDHISQNTSSAKVLYGEREISSTPVSRSGIAEAVVFMGSYGELVCRKFNGIGGDPELYCRHLKQGSLKTFFVLHKVGRSPANTGTQAYLQLLRGHFLDAGQTSVLLKY